MKIRFAAQRCTKLSHTCLIGERGPGQTTTSSSLAMQMQWNNRSRVPAVYVVAVRLVVGVVAWDLGHKVDISGDDLQRIRWQWRCAGGLVGCWWTGGVIRRRAEWKKECDEYMMWDATKEAV